MPDDEVDPDLQPERIDRLTLILSVVHERRGDAPFSTAFRHSHGLDSSEQTWQRRITVTEDWRSLDLGWLSDENAGLLFLENLTGRAPLRNPTAAELAEQAQRVVEVALTGDQNSSWLLTPACPMLATPQRHTTVRLRCLKGQTEVKVTVFPR